MNLTYTVRGHKLRFFVIARARSARSNLGVEIASRPSGARNDSLGSYE